MANSARAVLFDEECCQYEDGDECEDHQYIGRGEKGVLCGDDEDDLPGYGQNVTSNCKGPFANKGCGALRDDVESILVMPGCTLEVWVESDGLEKAEAKGTTEGVVFAAPSNKPFHVDRLAHEYGEIDENIESYRLAT